MLHRRIEENPGLCQGAFLHRDYLQHYTEVMPAGIRAHVDTHRNCEDIAMAFLVANVTAAPPVYVRSPSLRDLGQGIFKVRPIVLQLNLIMFSKCASGL